MALKLAPEAPEGCVLRRFFAQTPNLHTKGASGRAGGASWGGPGSGSPPRETLNDQSTLLTLLEGR
eukprot:4631781-Alexandrium_andersonii.AAC.1